MAGYLRDSEQALKTISIAFRRANVNLLDDIDRIFGNYAKRHNLTSDQAKEYLSQRVTQAEYERLLAKLPRVTDPVARADLLARINAPAAQYRMSRLEAVQTSIYAEMSQVAEAQLGAATAGFQRTIGDAYGRTLWDIQRGTGYGFAVNAMSPSGVQEILRSPWSGMHYSTRIWANQKALGEWLDENLTAGMMSGRSVRRLARDLTDRLGVGYHEAERLVRTETVYMANAAEMQSYREAGITHYRFLATLDNRTSEACGDMDGGITAVADALPGKNMPPMHPNCRSTTVAVFDDMVLSTMERRARDPEIGETMKVPADMTYKDWYITFVSKWDKKRN